MRGCNQAVDRPAGPFWANFQHMARLDNPSLVLNESVFSSNRVKHRLVLSPHRGHSPSSLAAEEILISTVIRALQSCWELSAPLFVNVTAQYQYTWLWVLALPCSTALWLRLLPPSSPLFNQGVKTGQVVLKTKINPELFPFYPCCHWEREL